MFEKTRIKLTALYLGIIMSVSIIFSFAIYENINSEFKRIEIMQERIKNDLNSPRFGGGYGRNIIRNIDDEDIKSARSRIITRLFLINVLILVLSGGGGYFLSGKTLKPIKDSMDEQNRFISDSSHELRTPLTVLRSETEISLRNRKLDIVDAKKILKSNLEEIEKLQKLSDKLLELAQNGKLINENMKLVSLNELLNKSIKNVEKLAKNKRIKIILRSKDVKVFAIEEKMIEVFTILLDNAIKYSYENGSITISSKIDSNKIKVSVKDNGIGIKNEEINKIFTRFYRSESSRSTDGFGLGLPIAKKIIESHKGAISASSNNNETVFTISLPKS